MPIINPKRHVLLYGHSQVAVIVIRYFILPVILEINYIFGFFTPPVFVNYLSTIFVNVSLHIVSVQSFFLTSPKVS